MKKLLFIALSILAFSFTAIHAQCPPSGYPAPGDMCVVAPTLCADLNGYCDTLGTNNVQQSFPGCPSNALNNDEWFGFIAGSTSIDIEVVPSNCQGTNGQFGMQGAIYEGSCTGPAVATQCNCVTTPFIMSYTNFIPGQVYYVVFDGCSGDICAFQVNVLQGSTLPVPPEPPGTILGPTMVCPGALTTYTLTNPNSATFDWTLDPPIGSIGGSPGGTINIAWSSTGTAQLCVTSSSPCFANGGTTCQTIVSAALPQEDEYYDLCIGDCVTCAGTSFCAPTGMNGSPVTLQNYLGCDSVVVCHITGIPAIQTNLGQITLCSPSTYMICGTTYTSTGFVNHVCDNASWQGCDSTVIVDLAILNPEVIISPPDVLHCLPGSTVVVSAANSNLSIVPGGTSTFLWTGPGIVGTNNGVTVVVDQPGQYCFTITAMRNGVTCTDQGCVTVTQNTAVPQQPQVSGNLMPCQNASATYTVTPVGAPPPTGYTWTTPNGEPITPLNATSISVNWNGPIGGQLCVTASNDCGSSPPACLTISVIAAPVLPVVTGPATVCANNQAQTYMTNTTQPPGVTYNWTVPPGASFSGSGTSINVNFSGASPGTGQVCLTVQNACGASQPGCVSVNITTPPATPTLSGPTMVCSSGGGINYSVTNPQGGVTYNWTAPAGATITGSGAMVSIDFLNASSGQVCVAAQNSCGSSSPACQNVQVIPAPTGTISGAGAICQGSGQTVDLTISLTGTGPWNVTYTNGGAPVTINNIATSPHTLTVSQPGTYTLTSLTVAGSNCTGTVSGSAVVTQNPSPTATLSGSGSICQGSGQQVPLTINFTGTAPWTVDWTLDGVAQASFIAGTNPYTWNIGQGQAGNLALTDVLDGNGCDGTASGTATVTVNTAPTVSGISADCDANNQNFTVIFTINGGDPASYSVTPLTGTLSGNVFTSNPIPSGSGYSFVVNDANNCNPVTVADNAVICNCATAVGDMDLTPVDICGDGPQSVPYDNTGQNFDGNDVVVFYLHSGSGLAVVAPVHSISDTTLVSFIPATMNYGTTYYLSAVVGDSDGAGGVDLNDPCLAVAQGTPVTFYEIPTAVLSGNDAVCTGQTGSLAIDFTGEGPWSISYDDGSGNIQTINGITANPYTLSVSPTATTTFCLTAMNDVNCTGNESGCGTVTINTGVVVTNFDVMCNATSTGYTITFNISGGSPASYFVSGVTGNIVGGLFTSNLIPTGTGYSLTVDDANNCDPQAFAQSIVICNCGTDAGQMDPAAVTTCGNGPITVTDAAGVVLDGDDITQYVLHTNSGSFLGNVIATNNNAPTFAFNPGTMSYGTTYYVSLIAGNDDGTGNVDASDPCFQVAAGTPVVFYEIPTASLSGATEICPGESADLTIDLTGDSPWAVTINGQQVTGIIGTPDTYTVTPSTTTVYNLTIVNDEYCADTISLSQTITVHSPPTISFVDAQCNTTGTGFTVCIDIAGGDPSCYQVLPATGTLTGSQFCSDEIPDGLGYSFQVTDCRGCPAVVASAPIVDCSCTTAAGDMAGAPLDICGNMVVDATQFYQGGEVFDGDDVLCYMLHNGNGQPILTDPSGQFSYQAGTMSYGTTYFISAIVGNSDGNGCVDVGDPCFDVGAGFQVTFHAIPTATLTGNTTICNGETTALALTLTGVGPWTVVYENASGNQFTVMANSSPFPIAVAPTSSNVYTLISLVDANCTGTVSGNATVTVNTPPTVANVSELCDASGQTYQVSFNILGGDLASYTVSPPGSLVGGVYTSTPIPTATPYSFSVDDANGCGPTIVSGLKVCDCNTDAGSVSLTLLNICVDEMAIGTPATGTMLDPNDVLVYILHTNNGNVLGTIIATNSTPTFSFNPGTMMTGVQYYISAVAGNNNGTGGVNLNDPCLDVSPGTPVIFRDLPTIAISGTTAICEGDSTTLTLTVTGTGPFNVNYTANGIPQMQQIPVAGSYPMMVTPLATTTVTLVSIEDLGAGCDNTSTQSVTITVNTPVEAGTSLGDLTFCQDAAQPIDLDDQVTGADPGGQWSGPSGNVPGGMVNSASLAPGIYPFTYLVSGASPCPDDQVTVTLTIHPTPVADAGQDQHLDCDVSQATLGGNGTTTGVNYAWTTGSVAVGNTSTITATTSGTYNLLVSNSFGCTDADEVVVTQSVTMPVLHIVISDVSCFGETDGFILVDSVSGGVAPYLFSIDGSPFTATPSFTNLGPGQHTITVADAGGCQSELTFAVTEPQEVTVEITGNFATNDPIIDLGDELVLSIISNPAVSLLDTIEWSVAGLDSCKTCPELVVMPVQQTNYSVRVESNGCAASDNLTVFVEKNRPVYVPNVFSPNDDGINDLFTIYAGESVQEIKSFLVFNRWGESVYEYYNFVPNDPAVGWDGTFRDKYMQPAVFTWFAEIEFIDGSVEIYQGDVTLIR